MIGEDLEWRSDVKWQRTCQATPLILPIRPLVPVRFSLRDGLRPANRPCGANGMSGEEDVSGKGMRCE